MLEPLADVIGGTKGLGGAPGNESRVPLREFTPLAGEELRAPAPLTEDGGWGRPGSPGGGNAAAS